jgi:hypothetical protein
MTEQSMRMRVGDRLPSFTAQLVNEFDAPIDLTGTRAWLIVAATTTDTVFGQPSPYVVEATIVDPVVGVVRYDWLQAEVDALIAGRYLVTVRLTDTLTGDELLEVPTRRTAALQVGSRIVGANYLVDTDGDLILTAWGQAIEV